MYIVHVCAHRGGGKYSGPGEEYWVQHLKRVKMSAKRAKKLDYSLNLTRFSLDNTVIALFKVFLR